MPIYKTNQKKDGLIGYRVRVNYTGADGKAHQLTRIVYGKSEAARAEAVLAQSVRHSEGGSVHTKKIRELYDEYMSAKKHEVRPTTLEKTRGILEREVLPLIGDVRLDRLTPGTLQRWKAAVSDRPISVRSKQNVYKELSAMLNFAVRLEYLPKNPLRQIGSFKEVFIEHEADKLHFYTPDQFKLYSAAARKMCTTAEDFGFFVFFNIAFYTGMRKGEINALKWSDIEGDLITVRRSVIQKLKGGDVEMPPKNKSSFRTLQAPQPLIKILDEQKAMQQKNKRWSEDWYVCGGPRPLRDSSICNRNNAFGNAAGLPHIRVHDFRHSHASLLCNEGINIQEIARRLGHSKIEITWNTYSHLYPREEERAVAILNKIV